MSFYRKYRPQVIEEIDNAAVRELLLSLLGKEKKDLPHAFLFSGPRGAGKTTAARIIAKLFCCSAPTKSKGPCGVCEQCVTIAEGRNLDVLEIDAASNRGIDEIRQLRDGIALTPVVGSHKVYIIDEVHMLTTEAFNALLKTLEEPPPHAVFVLATTDPQKVPATIISRATTVSFARAQEDELTHALSRIAKDEKLEIESDALALITQYADGAFRDAVKLLEQVSFHKGKITREVVEKLLSRSSEKIVETFIHTLFDRQPKQALTVISELVRDGKDIKTFLVSCLSHLEHLLLGAVEGKKTPPMSDIKDAIHHLSRAYADMRGASIAQLPLELAVVEFCEAHGAAPAPAASPSPAPLPAAPSKRVTTTPTPPPKPEEEPATRGLLTLEKLQEHWGDVIAELKPFNHSIAGVLRSSRPKRVEDGIVTIEAFYSFHQEKLSEAKTREMLSMVLKKLFGEKVKVDIVLGKK